MLPLIVVEAVSRVFTSGARTVAALDNVSFDIQAGEFVSIVGPSGCGKSTLLKAILGTHPPTQGEILTDGMPVRGPNRNVGIVYQNYALYDYLTDRKSVV